MKHTVRSKYLVFPVNTNLKNKKLSFLKGEKCVYELNIRLDSNNPDFFAYIDVSRFMGKTLEISVKPEMKLEFRETDILDIANLYNEPWRPQVHFTAKNGWINDPNGLIYIDGVYHMFYQYNPACNQWDNMHWGHAESQDLMHWTEKATALFPGDNGTRWSGSAIADKKNLLGVSSGGKDTGVLFFTATNPFSQCIAYSDDNFETITEYSKNPVVPHISVCNRDPKIVFCEERGDYIMALYLDKDIYCLLNSSNLTDWNKLQEIKVEGENECPDLFPINDKSGNRKWVFMGARDKYIVGDFADGLFTPCQEIKDIHYGSAGYAGQTFSNLPGGRVVRIVWERWNLKETAFNGQMSIPMELNLEKKGDKYLLSAYPVNEIESIIEDRKIYENFGVSAGESKMIELEDKPYFIKLKAALADSGDLKFTLFGCEFSVDFSENHISVGNAACPVSVTRDGFELTIISDICSLEIFADGGKAYMTSVTNQALKDKNLLYLMIDSSQNYNFEKIEIFALKSIWE